MWLDLVGLTILGVFTLVGLLRGTLASLLRIVGLVLAYAAAIWAAPRFGPEVARRLLVPGFLGIPLVGVAAFIAAYVAWGPIAWLLRARERRRRNGKERTPLDHLGGAMLGALQGAAVLLLLGWLGIWIEAGRAVGSLEALPDTSSSGLVRMSQTVVERGAAIVVDDEKPGARMAVQIAARPTETLEGVRSILANPQIEGLRRDRLFWSHVENGALDAALNRGSFLGVAHDDSLRAEFAKVGLVKEQAAADPRLFRDAIKEVLAEVGPRIRGLNEDPAMKELAQDPEIRAALESGDHLALMQSPGFRRIVARVVDDSGKNGDPGNGGGEGEQ